MRSPVLLLRFALLCGAVPVTAAVPAAASAQPARFAVGAFAGPAAGATVASGRSTLAVAGGPNSPLASSTSSRTLDLRLGARTVVGADARLRLGRARRWALTGEVTRAAGEATLERTYRFGGGGSGGAAVFSTAERFSRYSAVTTWRGALGVAREVVLPGSWGADLTAGAVVGRVRAAGDPTCPPVPPSLGGAGSMCEDLRRPAIALATPGGAFGAAVTSPAWRGLRARLRAGTDVVATSGARLHDELEPEPRGVDAPPRRTSTGRAARLLPSAALGAAVAFGR